MLRRLFFLFDAFFAHISKALRSLFSCRHWISFTFFSHSFFLVFFFSLSLFFSLSAAAQQGAFTHFGVEDGLPQSTVRSLIQDDFGRLWIATDGGVARYEGPRFTVFHKKDGLAEEKVTAMAKDKEGRIWFGHWGGGLSCFNTGADTLFTVNLPQVKLNKPINAVLVDKKGTVWVGTDGLGLISFDPASPNDAKVFGRQDGLLAKKVYCLMQDHEGILWLGTELGIIRYRPLEKRFSKLSYPEFPDDDVTAMYETSAKRAYLIGMRNKGLWLIKPEMDDVWQLEEVKSEAGGPFHAVNTIMKDKHGLVWIGTASDGLFGLSMYSMEVDDAHYTTANGLASNQVLSVLCDREGNVWAGTYLGLEKRGRADVQRFDLREEGTSTPVWCLVKSQSKNSYILGTERGLYRFNAKHEKVLLGDMHSRVNALVRDRSGILWVSVPGRGLARISENGGASKWFDRVSPSMQINCMGLDSSGNVWIGTMREGALRVNPKTMQTTAFGISDGFQSNGVQTMHCDRFGQMWFGTPGGFITRYNGEAFNTFSEKDGLTDNFILSIAEDREGSIWCGSYDGNYFKFNGARFGEINIGMANPPTAMCFDKQNRLWIVGANGLSCFSSESKTLSAGGISGIEVNANACLVSESGELWLGCMSGLINYTPGRSAQNQQAPILVLDRMQVSFRDHAMEQHMKLRYDENFVSFDFTAVSLTDPSKVRYKYQLQGLDKEWSPPTVVNSISYPNLPPGDYTFLLQACNNDGVWNKEPLAFAFHVEAPFWKTWWFWLIVFLLVLFGVIAFIQWRIQAVERKEQQKTELNKKIANIELKALRAQMNPHFIFNTLNSIQHFVVHNDPDAAQKYLSKFGQLIRTILSNSSLAYITIAEELAYLELYMELESLRFENKFDYTIVCDPDLDTSEEIPTMLIQPYVENAIVHGLMHLKAKGHIRLTLEKMEGMVKCTIEDNGVGRKRATEIKETLRPKHKSMGMAITSERLEILNNLNNSGLRQTITDLSDENGEAIGTRVELFIPLSSEES